MSGGVLGTDSAMSFSGPDALAVGGVIGTGVVSAGVLSCAWARNTPQEPKVTPPGSDPMLRGTRRHRRGL